MNKLTPSQAAFGLCRRLDSAYLNSVLEPAESGRGASTVPKNSAAAGPSIPQIGSESPAFVPLDLTKALRSVNFYSLHRLLTYPLVEMMSTAPPDLSLVGKETEALGFIVIYGAPGDYLDDNMDWEFQERLDMKLIVMWSETNKYKLRNSKNDDGLPVMRRHKRVSENLSPRWQRHEYRLFTDETAQRHNVDGTKTTISRRTLNPWPILVHYFRPALSASQRLSSKMSESISPSVTSKMSTSSPFQILTSGNDGMEYQRVTKRAKTGHNSSRDTFQVNESDSDTGSFASSASLSRAIRSIQAPLFQGELAPIVNTKSSSSLSSKHSLRDDGIEVDENDFSASKVSDGVGGAAASMDGIHPESTDNTMVIDSKVDMDAWAENSAENLAQSDAACIFISHYAPDASYSDEECPVLLVLGPDTIPCVNLSCFVDGLECASELVAPNVLRAIIPKHNSGVVPLWLIGKDVMGNVLAHSDSLPFYFLPTEASDGALSFAHAPSVDYFTSEVFYKFRHTTRRLDLTGNNLTNVDFLRNFTELRELVLDHNQISHWATFPPLPKLSSLSVNHNHILQIDTFVNHLIDAGLSNKLRYLSVLGNVANPALDRLEHRYYNFRIYIISKLPKLKLLDSRDVTEAERRHSQAIAEEEQQQQQLEQQLSPFQSLSPRDETPSSSVNTNGYPGATDSQLLHDFRPLSSSSSSFTPLTPDSPNLLLDTSDTFPTSIPILGRSPPTNGLL